MQALIEDDRFTYARDLLKMNTERAQKLVQMRPLDEQLGRSGGLYAPPFTSLGVC